MSFNLFEGMNIIPMKQLFENNYEQIGLVNFIEYLSKEKIDFKKFHIGLNADVSSLYNREMYKISDIHSKPIEKFIIFNFIHSKLLSELSTDNKIFKSNIKMITKKYYEITKSISWENVGQTMLEFKQKELQNEIIQILEKEQIFDETIITNIQNQVLEKSDLNHNYSYFLNMVKDPKDFIDNKLHLIVENFNSLVQEYNELDDVVTKLNNLNTIEKYILKQLDNIQLLCFAVYNEVNK